MARGGPDLPDQENHTNPAPGPLHLTRRADLLELELPAADLAPYDPIQNPVIQSPV
jgi:hypothetical protein